MRATSATTDRHSGAAWNHVAPNQEPDRGPTPLQRLVVDPTTFAEQVWGRSPLLERREATSRPTSGFLDLLSVDTVDALVARGLRRPALRMVRAGTILDPGDYCTSTRLGGQSVPDVADPGKVAAQITAGATLVLQSLHRQWDPIVDFADALMAEIGHPVQINAYLTPRRAAGLRTHRDDHDVFVMQVEGAKRWTVDGLGEVELRPGDVMYVPAGCDHSAATTDDLSLHLTVGILRTTYRTVLERLLRDGPAVLDEPLPLAFHTAGSYSGARTLAAGLDATLTSVAERLQATSIDDVVDAERRRQLVPYGRRGRVRSSLTVDQLSQESVLRWVTVMPRMQPIDGADDLSTDEPSIERPGRERVRVLLADRILRLPVVAVDAVDALANAPDGLRVADLPGLDPASRLVVGRRLVIEGACIVDE